MCNKYSNMFIVEWTHCPWAVLLTYSVVFKLGHCPWTILFDDEMLFNFQAIV